LTDKNDDVHLLILHNVNFVPTSPLRLLSPQQLSHDIGDHDDKGTFITTYANNSRFVWHNKQYSKPIYHRWNCNIPILRAGPIWNDALIKHVYCLITNQWLIVVSLHPAMYIDSKKKALINSMMGKYL
jgi:hypothetical protein